MGSRKKKARDIENIDVQFFEIDQKNKIAKVHLKFDDPDEIFDGNYQSQIPILNDDFMNRIRSCFDLVSSKYKIDLTIEFSDLKGYDTDTLYSLLDQNISLRLNVHTQAQKRENRLAITLLIIGTISFLAMLLIEHLWEGESIWKSFFAYFSDIVTMVTLWEAVTIIVVNQQESRTYRNSLRHRLEEIRFRLTGQDEAGPTVRS